MYKITLYDCNLPSCVSGVFSIYCDDIEKFEKDWIQLESDKQRIERFRKSKQGEMVTDYYSDSPELNIVQRDATSEVYYEKTVIMTKKVIDVLNGYRWPVTLFIDKCEFKIRYGLVFGRYLRLVKFHLRGTCQDWDGEEKRDVTCFGNAVLKNMKTFRGLSRTTEPYSENTIESIAYHPLGSFDSEEDMLKDYNDTRDNFFTDEELSVLFADIPGEAG